jgi:hypothetical protein
VRSDRLPVAAALVLLAAAVVASFLLPATETQRGGDRAASAFLDAWTRKLEGTYLVESTFTRAAPGASPFTSTTRLVQRPPDRLISGLGAVEGRLGGKIVRCGTDASGAGRCFRSEEDAPPYDQAVADEVDALSRYVLGVRPPYTVVDFLQGCFRLDLRIQLPDPTYGEHALFCFDPTTGAPSRTVIERPEVVETTTADRITALVTDPDLEVPDQRGTVVTVPSATSTTTTLPGSNTSTTSPNSTTSS